jgi:AraC-like DNA-binding protein
MHVGRILMTKPGFEHATRHIDNQPDLVTLFEFKRWFFERLKEEYSPTARWFLNNNDIHAVVLSCSVEAEYTYNRLMQMITGNRVDRLRVDEEVMRLLDMILLRLSNGDDVPLLTDRFKENHLVTMERAKEYMFNNFTDDISLNALAEYCYVSPFHFSRLFKTAMNTSPHQYLLSLRLAHAKFLITSSDNPVNDIAYESGFNSVEHFVTAYKQYFKVTPSQHRIQLA